MSQRWPETSKWLREAHAALSGNPDSPEVSAARQAYRDACVAAFESLNVVNPDASQVAAEGDRLRISGGHVRRFLGPAAMAKRALDALLSAQQQRGEDEEIVKAIADYRQRGSPSLSPETSGDILSALRSAGYEVRKRDA